VPTLPPQNSTPTLALSDSASLLARIAALEAKVQALEAMISRSADGVTITSPSNIVLKASKDLFIRAERDVSIDARGAASFTVAKTMTEEVGDKLLTKVGDKYRMDCGPVAIDATKAGDLLLTGARINVKGSGDVTIKGSKVTQN
jgi:type VI secretion system secreted protein VgrG